MYPRFSLFQSHLDVAHHYWKQLVQPGDRVIDATCGNGHDALYLCQLLQGQGHLYAYDLQPQAIKATQELFTIQLTTLPMITWVVGSHVTFDNIEKETIKLIVYNLGYLPGGDKTIITKTATTLASLQQAEQLILPGGAICVTCYPGHLGGQEEEQAILDYVTRLPKHIWSCCYHQWINRGSAPRLILLQKALSK